MRRLHSKMKRMNNELINNEAYESLFLLSQNNEFADSALLLMKAVFWCHTFQSCRNVMHAFGVFRIKMLEGTPIVLVNLSNLYNLNYDNILKTTIRPLRLKTVSNCLPISYKFEIFSRYWRPDKRWKQKHFLIPMHWHQCLTVKIKTITYKANLLYQLSFICLSSVDLFSCFHVMDKT